MVSLRCRLHVVVVVPDLGVEAAIDLEHHDGAVSQVPLAVGETVLPSRSRRGRCRSGRGRPFRGTSVVRRSQPGTVPHPRCRAAPAGTASSAARSEPRNQPRRSSGARQSLLDHRGKHALGGPGAALIGREEQNSRLDSTHGRVPTPRTRVARRSASGRRVRKKWTPGDDPRTTSRRGPGPSRLRGPSSATRRAWQRSIHRPPHRCRREEPQATFVGRSVSSPVVVLRTCSLRRTQRARGKVVAHRRSRHSHVPELARRQHLVLCEGKIPPRAYSHGTRLWASGGLGANDDPQAPGRVLTRSLQRPPQHSTRRFRGP